MRRRADIAIVSGFTLLLASTLLSGCSRGGNGGSYVARVNGTALTESEVAAARSAAGDARQNSREYVNTWIVNELLFQEAQRRGLLETPEVRRQLDASLRQIAIAELLNRELYSQPESALVSDQEAEGYFRANTKEFALREDVVNASVAAFSTRDAANAFRTGLLQGATWDAGMQMAQRDSLRIAHPLRMAVRQYFTQSTLYPQELWKLAHALGRNDVSYVLAIGGTYYVLQPHRLMRAGEIPDFDYARHDVTERLLIDRRRALYDQLVNNLRTKSSVEFRSDRFDSAGAGQE